MEPNAFSVHIHACFIGVNQRERDEFLFGNTLKLFEPIKGIFVEIVKTPGAESKCDQRISLNPQ